MRRAMASKGFLFHPSAGGGQVAAPEAESVVKNDVMYGAARIWRAGRSGWMKRTSLWDTNDKVDIVVMTTKARALSAFEVVTE